MTSAPLTVQQVWLENGAILNFVLKKENSSYFKRGNNWINLPEMLFPRRKLSYTVVTSGYCRSMISVVSAHLLAPSVPCDNWSDDSEQTSFYVAVYIIRKPLWYFYIIFYKFVFSNMPDFTKCGKSENQSQEPTDDKFVCFAFQSRLSRSLFRPNNIQSGDSLGASW